MLCKFHAFKISQKNKLTERNNQNLRNYLLREADYSFFVQFLLSKNTKKVRELWWAGVPPSVRGKVWQLAIGNDLNVTPGMCGYVW